MLANLLIVEASMKWIDFGQCYICICSQRSAGIHPFLTVLSPWESLTHTVSKALSSHLQLNRAPFEQTQCIRPVRYTQSPTDVISMILTVYAWQAWYLTVCLTKICAVVGSEGYHAASCYAGMKKIRTVYASYMEVLHATVIKLFFPLS